MTEHPPVNVILTYFDEAAYIREAVASVAAQTYGALDVIVVDDGSHHPLTVAEFPLEVQVIRRENGGPAAARNTGLDAVRHDWIAFIDADDLWPPDRLEHMMHRALASPQPDVVIGMVEHFISPELDEEQKASLYCPPNLLRGLFPTGMLIHRHTFDVVGRFPDDLDRHVIVDWVARLVSQPVTVSDIPETVLRRRLHTTNISHDRDTKYGQYLRTLKAVIHERRANSKTDH